MECINRSRNSLWGPEVLGTARCDAFMPLVPAAAAAAADSRKHRRMRMGSRSSLLLESAALILLLGCCILPPPSARAAVHYHDFILKETNFTRLCSSKSMMTVNDSLPGPVIRVHKGDTVYVNVHNHGGYGVTIHWHGVKQPRNPWSDGPEYVTQCPIEPGSNFTYEVIFSKEEGTLWWHAHSDWTRAGVHGAIVVYPKEGTTYPFEEPDGEEVVVLGSWYKADVNKEVEEDLSSGSDTPRSDAYVINGQPGDFCDCSKGNPALLKKLNSDTYYLQETFEKQKTIVQFVCNTNQQSQSQSAFTCYDVHLTNSGNVKSAEFAQLEK